MSITIEQYRVPGNVSACWVVFEICLGFRMRIRNKKKKDHSQ